MLAPQLLPRDEAALRHSRVKTDRTPDPWPNVKGCESVRKHSQQEAGLSDRTWSLALVLVLVIAIAAGFVIGNDFGVSTDEYLNVLAGKSAAFGLHGAVQTQVFEYAVHERNMGLRTS